ncbi:unnamed protein product [Cercopithifilaria johnstoni]|uniref:Uncharacterized protein n=1 Tax=Cercopithifilaria johnstoni TaxID=2874296 RepID=A0A8J2MBX1_9BILA|nr:unnamed protein product [Cercopithifilaria johnstoni]
MIVCFTMIQCQRLSNHQLNLSNSNRDLLTDDWMIEDEDDSNCDAVDETPWDRHFFRGMIVGFLIGLSGGVLLGFLCWQIQVHKEGYNL